ncbi:MAG: OmpA family protein [Cyclobacteriaceae bacterium]|nr:OmpA family protein [Cyclobacteriaceae bacterium]
MKTKGRISFRMGLMMMSLVILNESLVSCNATDTTKGGAIGAGTGGALGAVIGHSSDNTAVGAIIGATVGGAVGALIGNHMDKQAEELKRDLKGASVQRVGEGILITFNSGMQFDVNSTSLSEETRVNLDKLSSTIIKYDDTSVLIEGHTDNTGSDSYNLDLSERRARSVFHYLTERGVQNSRVTTKGYGETQPIATNDTDADRRKNRRVEVAIYANKKMKKLADKGEL